MATIAWTLAAATACTRGGVRGGDAGAGAGLDAGADANADSGPDAAPASHLSPESSTACPSGMALVDGDYCTSLELTCKKSWYAKWNDKTICDEFEKPSKCDGRHV